MEEGAVVLSIVGAVSLGIALFQFGAYAGGPRVYFAGGTAMLYSATSAAIAATYAVVTYRK